ncbi:related to glutathione-S-transferase [Armillaria ostoyae]|uniref:Related to glutathione-S-transferase n=1 Tax=Armillaria ostoyae TaxID=47428 RepID=A0A284R1K0_ARMOS|nr:related to glutathione-S-transferase [Armillaria ostoyae]
MSTKDTGRSYHRSCTGLALETVTKHPSSGTQDITLFGSCFCPFVQRVWVALEYLEIPYNYCMPLVSSSTADKPKDLLEVSPKGLVPGLKLHNFSPPRALNESTVIMEYIQDVSINLTGRSLLPPTSNPYARALVRLQSDHVNRSLVPAFYRYLQAQDTSSQIESGKEFHSSIQKLVALLERAEKEIVGVGGVSGEGEIKALSIGLGLWIKGNDDLGWIDVMAGPWLFRATNVLKDYRGFIMPSGQKFNAWMSKLLGHPAFVRTCSTEDLYLDSYERYAFNRPNTSQVANAINSGRALP